MNCSARSSAGRVRQWLVSVGIVACVTAVALNGGCNRRSESTESPSSSTSPGVPGSSAAVIGGDDSQEQILPELEAEISPGVDPVTPASSRTLRTPDGRVRSYRLFVPASVPSDRSVPLLVALHGGTGWGEQFEGNSRFDRLAEANGFLVVFPDGVGAAGTDALRTWNGGYCWTGIIRSTVAVERGSLAWSSIPPSRAL